MSIFIFMYHHIDDIIFKGRNKKYGAYNLRATYDLRLARAMFFSISTFVLFVSAPFLFTREFKVYEFVDPKTDDSLEVIIDCELVPKFTRITGIQQGRSAVPELTAPRDDNFYISNVEPDSTQNNITVPNTFNSDEVSSVSSDVFGSESGELNGTADGIQGSKGTDMDGIFNQEKVEEVFISVEQMPVFGSGMSDLLAYLSKEIKYPAIARDNGIIGTVVIQFVIDKNGNVTHVELVKGIGGGCDQEALRVVKKMPAWSPGKQQGRPVSVRFTLPVMFKLQK